MTTLGGAYRAFQRDVTMGQNLGKTASALSKTKGELNKTSSFLAELMGVPGVRELANDLAERSASELYTASAEAPKPQEPGESEQPAQQAAEKLDPLPSAPELGDTTDTTKNSQTSTETTPSPPAVPTPVNIPAAAGAAATAATAATAAPAIPPPPPPPAKRAGGPPPPPPPPPPRQGRRGGGGASAEPPEAPQKAQEDSEQLAKATLQRAEGGYLADIATGIAATKLKKMDPNSPPQRKCTPIPGTSVELCRRETSAAAATDGTSIFEKLQRALEERRVAMAGQHHEDDEDDEDEDDGGWATPRSSFGNRRRFL